MKRLLHRTLQVTIASVVLVLACIIYCNWRVESLAKGRTYSDPDAIPHRHVGLLLGTSKFGTNGVVNRYYRYRIEAAARLMQRRKIDYIIASGDNSKDWYNEPETMRADLIAAGVDSTRIVLDYAGFRTFDSMIRLREIFSQQQVTVISQKFHNERALYIAQREKIDAIGFNAADIRGDASFKTRMRERLARVKVFIDYLIGTKPKFLGPKVDVPSNG